MAYQRLKCERCKETGNFDLLHNDDAACSFCGKISKSHETPSAADTEQEKAK